MPKLIASCLAAAFAISGIVAIPAAGAQSRDDQGAAREEARAGNMLKLRDIEKRVLPTMKGAEYLGPAFDSASMVYRLKFIRDGRVIIVDVDARTGRVVRRGR